MTLLSMAGCAAEPAAPPSPASMSAVPVAAAPAAPPPADPDAGRDRVVGGSPIKFAEAPWQVEIQNLSAKSGKWFHWCGGALIAPRWVLTAGHCILTYGEALEKLDMGKLPAIRRVLAGSALSGSARMQVFTIVKAYVPPEFHNGKAAQPFTKTYNDIALLYLDRPMTMPPGRTITLAPGDASVPPLSTNVSITGWGATEPGGDQQAQLLKARLNVVPADQCPSARGLDPTRILCAWKAPLPGAAVVRAAAGTCQGDSGGPLVSGDVDAAMLIGIVSLGPAACWDGPAVFTRVAAFLPWIQATMASAAP